MESREERGFYPRRFRGTAATCGTQIVASCWRSETWMMPASKPENLAIEARCVRLNAKAADADAIQPAVERRPVSRGDNEVLIEIRAAAVNPSDVKAATGLMPYAVFPRTPGRDYAGVIVDGPAGSVGRAG